MQQILLRMMNHCLHLTVQSFLLEKVHDKKNPPTVLFFHTLILKLQVFPPLFFFECLKNSSLHAFSCKQEAKSSCAY